LTTSTARTRHERWVPSAVSTRVAGLGADRPFRYFLAAWLGILLPYLGTLVGRPPSSTYRTTWTFALIAIGVAIAAVVDLASLRDPTERRMRLLVAAAFSVWAVEELLEFRYSSDLFLILHDGLFVLFYLLLGFAALAGHESEGSRQLEELRRLARLETALFASGMFIYFVIIPVRLAESDIARPETSAVLYLTLDGFLGGLFAWRYHRSLPGRDRLRWRRMCLGAVLFLLSDGLFFFSARKSFDLDAHPILDLLWYLPQLWIVAAIRTPPTGSRSSGVVSPLDRESSTLRFAPAFLYAGLVPAIHLLSELVAGDGPRPELRAQGVFALALATVLGLLAAVHQGRISRLQAAMRVELLESRRQLANSMKLEAIGRLAAGVAHDFNNLLTVVVGRTDLLLAKAQTPELRSNLEMVLRAARRAADLTSELLAVGQREIGFRSRVEVGALLRGLVPDLEAACGPKIDLRVQASEEPLEIAIDPLHLERIVRNLTSNACEAMPEGGVLGIGLARREVTTRADSEGDALPPGCYAELTVRDDGVGMDAETQRRLFEPFFTTKSMGRGSGLGLASVYGLVRQNEGRIDVSSELGVGSTFVVLFPLVGPMGDASEGIV